MGLIKLNETNARKKLLNTNDVVRNASVIMTHNERQRRHAKMQGEATQCTLYKKKKRKNFRSVPQSSPHITSRK